MRSFRSLTLAVLLAVTVACDPGETPPPEPTPESVVLGLFDLAAQDDPDPQLVDTAFGPIDDEQRYAALLDAVRALDAGDVKTAPEIVDSYTMENGDRTGFDLEGGVGDGGAARYSVLLDTTALPGTIVWFSGPGIEWPERKRRGPGISTSAPPRSDDEG